MIILLDAGHGESTPGKRSPDGRLREYKYCREIANEVKKQLIDKGFNVELVVTDDTDVPLMQRCRIVKPDDAQPELAGGNYLLSE